MVQERLAGKARARVKNFRRIAARRDKLAATFLTAAHRTAAVGCWL